MAAIQVAAHGLLRHSFRFWPDHKSEVSPCHCQQSQTVIPSERQQDLPQYILATNMGVHHANKHNNSHIDALPVSQPMLIFCREGPDVTLDVHMH